MVLSKRVLLDKPLNDQWRIDEHMFSLPERVLQFGTGVLLRGLPDYFIDKANKAGIFNGRIVVVKSTEDSKDNFDRQDSVFTHCIRGVENGVPVREHLINTSISRVLYATQDWHEVLNCASNPSIQLIISNTTEVGISLTKDNVHASPPISFPGKLLAFLYQRYKVFNGDMEKGLVIVPTELIPDNGVQLLSILLELAHQNGFEISFLDWLENANEFCNSLVDCIVPGSLPPEEKGDIENELGYIDDLMIMSEPYHLWAIESSSKKVKDILSFAKVDSGFIVAPDIRIYRELKLRLLNGTHTFCCGIAHLAGFKTVSESMQDESFRRFVDVLVSQEIIPAITGELISDVIGLEFAEKVINRFINPHIKHLWLAITVQYTSKMCLRNIPLITAYLKKTGSVPGHMAISLAAYILFMKSAMDHDGHFYGSVSDKRYRITDDYASYYFGQWQRATNNHFVHEILSNEKLWQKNLAAENDLLAAVEYYLDKITTQGMSAILAELRIADKNTVS